MADSEVQGLTELTSPSGDDLVFAVDDPAGSPLPRKLQVATIVGYLVTTAGDILYATAARTLARLGIGTAGQVLAVNAGATAPAWANAAGADGWTPDTATWTYASASTFTVATDVTAQFGKGTKLKLTQTTAKYFYVTASSYGAPNTTVTVTGGTDYTLANAAITLPRYSYADAPQGFPEWFAWAPTHTGFSVDPTPGYARFRISGHSCTFGYDAGAGGTSNATSYGITLPVVAITRTNARWRTALGVTYDNSAFVAAGDAEITSASSTVAFTASAHAAWTNSGTKAATIVMTYEF